ncbi:MAG: radical SAM protein [Spirochaetes bacterium]|nr:radical SAM protein [Spirochaetota bacterium]
MKNKKNIKKQIPRAVSFAGYVRSLMIMCTYACQLKCSYCEVKHLSLSMPKEVLHKAIDLLLSTKSQEVLLRFWGGEPLLRWDFIKEGIKTAKEKAVKKRKTIRFMITTNGLLLDKEKIDYLKRHPVEVMFSLDGDEKTNQTHRFTDSGSGTYQKTLNNLKLLIGSSIPYFINIVVSPVTTLNLCKNLEFLKELGSKRVQLCYQNGNFWPEAKKNKLINELKKFIIKKGGDSNFLMNYTNDCEPTMLSQEILVDTDGKVYSDAAVFMEKKFPRLRGPYFRGRVNEIKAIDSLFRSRRDLYHIYKEACSKTESKIFLNNIDLGLKLDSFFNSAHKQSIASNEHPLLVTIMKSDFHEQKKVLSQLKIKSLFLYLNGPCFNNCIFCMHKESPFSDLFKIELKLKENLKIKEKELCIIGNDPLNHPEIEELVDLSRQYGFKEIQIMTSGERLSDSLFCKRLILKGATSFSLPLFGDKKEIHDPIVGTKGSFSQVIRAIQNILKLKKKVYIHTNLIKQNLKNMKALEGFVRNGLRVPFVILPIRPKTTNISFSNLMPAYREIIKQLKGVHSLLGFPLCIVKQVQKELFRNPGDISDSMKLYVLGQRFFKPALCRKCFHFNQCTGTFREYLNYFGIEELTPFIADKT